MHGTLVISLDCELYWGVRDKRTIQEYQQNLLGVRRAAQEMLTVFSEYDVHATWATVGFLFFGSRAELTEHLPQQRPAYLDRTLCPYRYMAECERLEEVYHFAPDLIESIQRHSGQEIASHTFSHYYCLEPGQDVATFREDIAAAVQAASARGITLRSLVFPRNQYAYANGQGVPKDATQKAAWYRKAAE